MPNRGFTAERGLRLYGKLHADFGINMPLAVLFEASAVKMVAELTPIRWGVTKEEVDRKTPQGGTIKGICFRLIDCLYNSCYPIFGKINPITK